LINVNKGDKMKKYANQFNELIVMAEKAKKKGGSMAAVFKLIQELLDFEEKIQECCNAQEMAENRQKIESFMGEIDKMYDVLFEMARGGISNIRSQRQGDTILNEEQKGITEGPKEIIEEDVEEDIEIEPIVEKSDKRKTPVMLNVPTIPKM
jgi:hypothetical protein